MRPGRCRRETPNFRAAARLDASRSVLIVSGRIPVFFKSFRNKRTAAGIEKLSGQNRGERWPADRSGGGGRCDPNAIGIGSKETKSGSADHVSLGVEGVVDDGVGGKKSLG